MAKSEGTVVTDNRDSVEDLISTIRNPTSTKSTKKAALSRIRELERRDGKDYYPSYNGVSRNPSEMARYEEWYS